MHLTIVVECQPSGPIPGYQVQHVDENDTISSIIHTYCDYKGVLLDPELALISRNRVWCDSSATVAECNIRDGDRLNLVKDEGLRHTYQSYGERLKRRWNRWWTLTVICLICAFIGLLTTSLVYSLAGFVPFGYGVVFDAGSTHTEMLLYQWNGEKWRDTGVVKERHTCDMSGGIGELFKTNPKGVQTYLDKCLQQAVSIIPKYERSSSPVYLAATAGLRMLQLNEPEIVEQILGNVSTKLSSSGLMFAPGDARVIAGSQEAVAGWVTVNFLSQNLLPGDKPHVIGEMLGALDMGGASIQITFELQATDPNATQVLKLYGQDYHLYGTSYMCHGINQINRRVQVALYKNWTSDLKIIPNNPCLAKNGNKPYIYLPQDVITACSNTKYANKIPAFNYIGTSNGTECLSHIRNVISVAFCQSNFIYPNCIDNPPPKRPPNSTFVGFSTFYYIASGFNLTSNDNSTDFLNRVLSVCNMDQGQLNKTVFPEVGAKFKKDLCTMGLYFYVLLNEIYQFTPDEWKRTFYAKSIENTTVGWALGFMTESTNAIPAETAQPGIPLPWFIVLILLFVSFVGIALWFGKSASQYSRAGRLRQTHPASYGTIP